MKKVPPTPFKKTLGMEVDLSKMDPFEIRDKSEVVLRRAICYFIKNFFMPKAKIQNRKKYDFVEIIDYGNFRSTKFQIIYFYLPNFCL